MADDDHEECSIRRHSCFSHASEKRLQLRATGEIAEDVAEVSRKQFNEEPEVPTTRFNIEDVDTPVSTFRAWIIGLLFSFLGASINNFFAERLPGIALSGFVAQLLAYPAGKLCERVLPNQSRAIFGYSWTLNPGPFSAKEHMLITIMANVSFGSAYATSVIITQRLPQFYNQAWAADWKYQMLLVISSQIIGYGLAGISRRFLVYPATAIWPSNLAILALNQSFHASDVREANGWRISQLRWFRYLFLGSSLYFFIPNYLFTAMSQFNWITWIAPEHAILAAMTGSLTGLGINPMPTFDYNIVSGIVDPLITPFPVVINLAIGMLCMGLVFLPAIWFNNIWFSSYLPISINKPYDHFAEHYNVSRILNPQGRLNIEAFEAYSPVYLSAANALTYGGYFAIYGATLVYTYLYHGRQIMDATLAIFDKKQKTKITNQVQSSTDREVPNWWYLSVMAIGIAMALLMITSYPTDMPVWGIFFALAIGFLFIIPIGLITSVSNVEIGLNVLSEMVAGFTAPGKPLAMMIFKTYGTITLGQGLSFAADLKLGRYANIPERTLFSAQIVATIVSALITLFVTNWQVDHIKGFCTQHQKQKFTCPQANSFFTSSVIWGVIGPQHNFGQGGIYHVLLWGFLVGLVLPWPVYFASKKWPKSGLASVNVPIILAGFTIWAPFNLSYMTAALPVGYFFNIFVRGRYPAWWQKYNYITATALNTGIAIAGLLAFILLQNPGIQLDWIGNAKMVVINAGVR